MRDSASGVGASRMSWVASFQRPTVDEFFRRIEASLRFF